MKFTESKFVEAIELIQAIDFRQRRKDKRRAERTGIRVAVTIKLGMDSQTEWTEATLRDISARGVKLEIDRAIETGNSFLLRLPAKAGNESGEPLVCRVVYCVPQKEVFLIGAEFIGHLTERKTAGDNAADLNRIQRSILD